MKHFLAKFLTVAGIGTILIVLTVSLALLCHYNAINSIDFSLSTKIDTVITGNSMPECAIDDALLPGVLNWSQSGNRTGVTYFKLRKLLSENPQIKYVFYSFGPYVYSEKDKNKFPGGVLQVLPMISFREAISLHFPITIYDELFLRLVRTIRSFDTSLSVHSYGAYLNLNRNKLAEDIELRKKQRLQVCTSFSKYYQSIVALCRQHDVRLIFLQTPIFQRDRYYDDVSWIKKQYFPEIEYWDFGNLVLPPDCYGDVLHLNRQGTLIFTPIFGEKLEIMREEGRNRR